MGIYDKNGNELTAKANLSYISVDLYGAKGDGETDDTSAIQAALDAAMTGGVVFFPIGTYRITEHLIIYSGQIIDLNGSTILQGAEINNLMMGYCNASIGEYNGPHDIVVQNGIFDGSSYETNNTLLGFCHAKNITIRNCTFKNAYGVWHNIEINSSKHVMIKNCCFEGARKTGQNGCMIQVDSFDVGPTWPWGNGAIDGTVSYMIEISGCHFYNNTVSPAIGNHSATPIDYLKIHDCTFEGLTTSRGAINFQSANHVDCYNNTFVGCTKVIAIDGSGSNTLINNRIDGETIISSGYVAASGNIVNGVLN